MTLKQKKPLPRKASMRAASIAKEQKVRMKKCALKSCRTPFPPRSMSHVCCSVPCSIEHVALQKAAKIRKERQAGLKALKTRQDWLREAQAAFNTFIRTRDHDQPCISCGRFHTGSFDAGHYRSVGAAPAYRFNENNCHKQCVPCNQHKGGNIVEYRIRLVEKIGRFAVELLEQEPPPAKYSIEDAQAIKKLYMAKTKQLKEMQS